MSRDDRRGSSSSSSSSTEDSDPRQGRSRRRSPAPPKLPTFTGEDIRRELQFSHQGAKETLEEYSQGIHFFIMEGRIQATCVHNNLSSFLPVKCGVPQGCILGLLLFIKFINDIPKYVQSCHLYAYDTMVEKSGKTLDEIVPCIQSDIDYLLDWLYSNKLTVSKDKSCCMLIGSSQRLK